MRLWDGLCVGVYPYNATFTTYPGTTFRPRYGSGWFDFPSTAEVSWAF